MTQTLIEQLESGIKTHLWRYEHPNGDIEDIVSVSDLRALIDEAPEVESVTTGSNPPYSNCSFKICDLPGVCTGHGKCHHPSTDLTKLVWELVEARK